MKQYQNLMRELLDAPFKGDRTGTGTYSIFGHQMRFDLQKGFPLVTGKFTPLHLIIKELLWFLDGNTNAHDLAATGCHIWDEWATEDGELGPIYGKQWRSWEKPRDSHKAFLAAHNLRTKMESEGVERAEVMEALENIELHTGETEAIDQIKEVIEMIKTKPHSRRLIVSAWNPSDMPDESISPQENVAEGRMALAACHTLFQFYVSDMTARDRNNWVARNYPEEYGARLRPAILQADEVESVPAEDVVVFKNVGADLFYRKDEYEKFEAWVAETAPKRAKLSCQLYQRSADAFLGVPFNIASYALLTHMIAQVCKLEVGDLIWTGGDCHIYSNHVEQTKELVSRDPRPLPTLKINDMINDIDSFTLDDFELVGYDPHPAIKGAVAV